jgi:hypothetical protein
MGTLTLLKEVIGKLPPFKNFEGSTNFLNIAVGKSISREII